MNFIYPHCTLCIPLWKIIIIDVINPDWFSPSNTSSSNTPEISVIWFSSSSLLFPTSYSQTWTSILSGSLSHHSALHRIVFFYSVESLSFRNSVVFYIVFIFTELYHRQMNPVAFSRHKYAWDISRVYRINCEIIRRRIFSGTCILGWEVILIRFFFYGEKVSTTVETNSRDDFDNHHLSLIDKVLV